MSAGNSYTETLPLLYAENTFLLGDSWLMIAPKELWHSGRFELVQSVRMSFIVGTPPPIPNAKKSAPNRRYRDYWSGWYTQWRVLAALCDLRDLVVSLDSIDVGYGPENFSKWEDIILEPAMKVQGVASFVIVLPWPKGDGRIAREEHLPFRLVRVEHHLMV